MKKIIVFSLLALALSAATAGVYFHNGRCFACWDEYAGTDNCTRHMGPCSPDNASLENDECKSYACPDCNTCNT